MSLAVMGFITIIVFMCLIMFKRLTAFSALVFIPILFGVVAGFGPKLGPMMQKGLMGVAPAGLLCLFAILFFGVLSDVGLFDPVIVMIVKAVKGDPLRIAVGTALLSILVCLQGEGAVAILVTYTALLPLYRRIGMRPVILGQILGLMLVVKNLFPWSSPPVMVMTVLHVEAPDLFNPLIPVVIAGFIYSLIASYWMGIIERRRLGVLHVDESVAAEMVATILDRDKALKRPKMFWVNLVMTLAIMAGVILNWMPTTILFILGLALALFINYRSLKEQQDRLVAHAKSAMIVVGVIFAAGLFMGIFSGTKTTEAMATYLIEIIPRDWGPHMALITALVSAPATFLVSNEVWYFGIMPILVQMGAANGVSGIDIGRAALMGNPLHNMTPLIGSIWLSIGMLGISYDECFKFGLPYALGIFAVFVITSVLFGVFPI